MNSVRRIAVFISVTLLILTGSTEYTPPSKAEGTRLTELAPVVEGIMLTPKNKGIIQDTFDTIVSLEQKAEQLGLPQWLVESPEVNISLKEFIFYKKSKELILLLNNRGQVVSDSEMIQDMIKERLTVNYAKSSKGVDDVQQLQEQLIADYQGKYRVNISALRELK